MYCFLTHGLLFPSLLPLVVSRPPLPSKPKDESWSPHLYNASSAVVLDSSLHTSDLVAYQQQLQQQQEYGNAGQLDSEGSQATLASGSVQIQPALSIVDCEAGGGDQNTELAPANLMQIAFDG